MTFGKKMKAEISKKRLAEVQIHSAIKHFSEKDYITCITLAGSADSMIGNALLKRNQNTSLDDSVFLLQQIQVMLGEPESPAKEWRDHLNYIRNELKHWNDSNVDSITCDWIVAADEMIDRAIKNYMLLFGDATDEMTTFMYESLDRMRTRTSKKIAEQCVRQKDTNETSSHNF
jgi:hypothetical protein